MGVGLPVMSFCLLNTRSRTQAQENFQAGFSDMDGFGDMSDGKFPEKQTSIISIRNMHGEEWVKQPDELHLHGNTCYFLLVHVQFYQLLPE